ncbi:MAG TPA: hypothetical protein PKU91_02125 [Phycisphaerales bacterium]|nr:hypothetical protein [Phycisphaerales bacterium]
MDNAQTTTSMGAGLVTSVFLHAAVAVVLWQHGDALLSGSRADASGVVIPLTPPPVQATPDDPESDPVRLGIAEGIAETPTWLGYKDPTRHAATPATIDQAAFTIATGPINDGIVGGETEAPAQGEGERTIPPEPLQSAAVPTPSTPSPEDLPPPMADPVRTRR